MPDWDFQIDTENAENISGNELASWEQMFPNITDPIYKVGEKSKQMQKYYECNPEHECDCIKISHRRGVDYFDDDTAYNCLGYALDIFTGVEIHKVDLSDLANSVTKIRDEHSTCLVNKGEFLFKEIEFGEDAIKSNNASLVFFVKSGLPEHVAKCFSKLQIKVNGIDYELQNYCISKMGALLSMAHHYHALEGENYGYIYNKMLSITTDRGQEVDDTNKGGLSDGEIAAVVIVPTAFIVTVISIILCKKHCAKMRSPVQLELKQI